MRASLLLVLVSCSALVPTTPARADDEPSVVEDAQHDCSAGCAALDTFGSHKEEAAGGPILNWAAWGCWAGGVLGFALTPAGPPCTAPLGAAFGLMVGAIVDDYDVGLAWVWAIPAMALGGLLSALGAAVIGGFIYYETTYLSADQANLYVAVASAVSLVLVAGSLLTGPMAMAGIVHGLHAEDEVAARPRAETPLRLAGRDAPMAE